MMLAPGKKIILRFFLAQIDLLVCQISTFPDTSNRFLPINITCFANIWFEYFFLKKFSRVFHQSKVELSDLGENWAKTSPLLLQIFESSNCVDSHIVQWRFYFIWMFVYSNNNTLARTGYAGGAPLPTGALPQVFRLHVMIMWLWVWWQTKVICRSRWPILGIKIF